MADLDPPTSSFHRHTGTDLDEPGPAPRQTGRPQSCTLPCTGQCRRWADLVLATLQGSPAARRARAGVIAARSASHGPIAPLRQPQALMNSVTAGRPAPLPPYI